MAEEIEKTRQEQFSEVTENIVQLESYRLGKVSTLKDLRAERTDITAQIKELQEAIDKTDRLLLDRIAQREGLTGA